MDSFSGIALGISLMGLVLLIVLLIAVFYKPPKRLKVDCKFKTDNKEDKYSIITVSVENIGKKKLKLVAPYVRFSHATHTKLYQMKPDILQCKFPQIVSLKAKMSCDVDLHQYKESLENHDFHPTHMKVIMKDTAGLEFESPTLIFKD